MLRTMNSPADTHNDHLRHLLDQRTTRANHGRFPSLSEMSDSPSVYSHAHFSPHPLDQADIDAHTNSFNFHIPSSHRGRPHSPDRQTMHDPNASVLDFDEDPRLSYASSSLIQDHDQDEQYSDEEGESDVVDGEADPRMSMLGPKMRFHGLAPWEMGEEPVEEEGEDSDSGQSKAPSIFHRGRNHAGKKGLGIGSSQRAQGASRPSADSSRSQTKSKKSSDTSSSNSSGALQALAQASMSSTSLVTPSPSPAPTGRHKFTMGFGRPRTPSRVGSGSTSPIPPDPSPQSTHFQYHISNPSPSTASPRSEFARPDGYRSPGRSSTSSQPEVHPYANPDLVVTYAQQNTSQSPNRSNFQTPSVTRKASTSTLTHSVVSTTSRPTSTLPKIAPLITKARRYHRPSRSMALAPAAISETPRTAVAGQKMASCQPCNRQRRIHSLAGKTTFRRQRSRSFPSKKRRLLRRSALEVLRRTLLSGLLLSHRHSQNLIIR
ncbi:hypothetical protein PLICRDRAFT_406652 [Plicaturopsis crispa FD-325 SS-3]|nr:hypothetical protein PLICRDRAFT_406652 [Plicaturopsis crispa FD-325 SS-3]